MNAVLFIIDTIFFLATLLVVLRFLLQMVRADYRNPLSQAIVLLTNPLLQPLRRLLPRRAEQDWAAAIVAFSLVFLNLLLVQWLGRNLISLGGQPVAIGDSGLHNLMLMALVELGTLVINIYLFIIILQVVISWIAPGVYNPNTVVLHNLSAPILRPIQTRLPATAGLDFSPLVAMLLLMVIKLTLLPWLANFAAHV